MYTLGIETSCDETACSVLKNDNQIMSNVISSSLVRHIPFGGVVPEIASRHCLEVIDYVYQAALKRAGIHQKQIGLIAVTRGPGLIGSIFVGLSFAKALSFSLGTPMIGVNHIEAHLEANFISNPKPISFIGLIVSGGHTSLLRYHRNRYELLGETIDDAIGEAYDKVAKILGLGYPGGPVVDRLAQKGNPKAFSFTKPKQEGKFDFSFSGIKTAVLRLCESNPSLRGARRATKQSQSEIVSASTETLPRNDMVSDVCASFQETVIGWIVEKTILACKAEKMKNIVVGGGVSANSKLRKLLAEESDLNGINLYLPSFELTTDNAAMIARLGYSLFKKGKRSRYEMNADPSLRIGEETND